MRPRDWFAVGLRLLGAYVFYRSITQWLSLLADSISQVPRSELAKEFEASTFRTGYIVVFAVGYLVLSYVFVFGAERITQLAFNERAASDADLDED